jgi:hypothetical protein
MVNQTKILITKQVDHENFTIIQNAGHAGTGFGVLFL